MKRIVFLDYLRCIACLMVMVVHSCEPFYLGVDGLNIATSSDAFWATFFDSAVRSSVPLFVIASAFLLFPINYSTGEFFRRRLKRVLLPFVFWACIYCWAMDGKWLQMAFNFPMSTGGHLWFVPMLLGLYLLMPLLSPWAEKASEKEVRLWLLVWLFTTTFPYLRKLWGFLYGSPDFGAVPFLYGECPWNMFGTFHYVSGFFGYMLLGLWMRKFAPSFNWSKTLSWAIPAWVIGYAIVSLGFFLRIPDATGYPLSAPYSKAVDLEMSWEFCSLGVALTTFSYFLVIRKFNGEGVFYQYVVRPLSEASYGTYLLHMLILTPVCNCLRTILPTPLVIVFTAIITFISASLISIAIRRVPLVGKYICG